MSRKVWFGILALLLGGMMIYEFVPDTLSLLAKPVDALYEDAEDLHAGQHVLMDIRMAYDTLISVTTETTQNGKKVSSKESSRYYAVPAFTYDEEMEMIYLDHLILVEIEADDFSTMDRAIRLFDEWWEDETQTVDMPDKTQLSIEGKLRKLTEEERSYVEDYFETEDFEEYMPPYVVKPLNKTTVFLGTIGGFVAVAAGILFFVWEYRTNKAEKLRNKELKENGYYKAPAENITFDNDKTDSTI